MSLQELETGMQTISFHLSQRSLERGGPDAAISPLSLSHKKKKIRISQAKHIYGSRVCAATHQTFMQFHFKTGPLTTHYGLVLQLAPDCLQNLI